MKKTAALLILATAMSQSAMADNYTYQSIYLNTSSGFSYPGLDLYGASATLSFNDSNALEESKLNKAVIKFENAKDLTISNFTYDQNAQRYFATVKNAWVFKEISVAVVADGTRSQSAAEIRITVPSATSNTMDNGQYYDEVELANLSGTIFETTAVRTSDTASFTHLGKRVRLSLKDRYQSESPINPPPTYGEADGFKIEANWLGHGVRSFYVRPNISDNEIHRFQAIGIELEQHELGNEEVDTWISVKYSDNYGHTLISPAQPLSILLNEVFADTLVN